MSRTKGAKLKRAQRDAVLKKKHWKSQPVFKPQKDQKNLRKPQQKQHTQPIIPFDVHDKILLVGEGENTRLRTYTDFGLLTIIPLQAIAPSPPRS
jgi:hypothetical protein